MLYTLSDADVTLFWKYFKIVYGIIYFYYLPLLFYSYTKNAIITSDRFRDRPMTPQESVVYWTEYVLRHKGAHHLKSEALNLTWYQYMLLDVIFVAVVSFLVIGFLIYKTFRLFYSHATNYLINVKVKQQ